MGAMQDTEYLPSRKKDESYSGLFGRDSAYDPMKLLSLVIILLLVICSGTGVYYECVVIRKRRGYRALDGVE